MDIILLQKIQNLGQLGDVVSVKPGFARNYLIPQGKAMRATSKAKAEVEGRKAELLAKEKDVFAKAQGRADILKDLMIEIAALASEEGKLFGSVGANEISIAVAQTGIELDRSEITLPDGPIKTVGVFSVSLILHPEVTEQLNIKVIPEDIV